MQAITAFVAVLGSFSVLFSRPVFGLVAFTMVLIWYPLKVTLKLGTIDFSASRIVILVLIMNLFLLNNRPLKRFRFVTLDIWVICLFSAQILSGAMTTPDLMDLLVNRSGAIFDLALPYFAVRLCIQNREDYTRYMKAIFAASVPYALIGLFQFFTGQNPYTPILRYAAWGGRGDEVNQRFGFYRAYACMPIHILYGVFFVQIIAFVTSIYHDFIKKLPVFWIGICFLIIGLITSLSSGPYLAFIFFGGFLIIFKYRRYWRVITITAVMMCIFIEVTSNRHFYDVIDRFAINSRTAWYRSRLMEVAILEGGMTDHWAFGHGYNVDPRWCDVIDGRDHTDICNHYLLILSRFGLLALVPFFGMVIQAFRSLHRAFKQAVYKKDKWLIWSLFASLSSLAILFFTVSLFGQPQTLFYMLLAFCGTTPLLVSRAKPGEIKGRINA